MKCMMRFGIGIFAVLGVSWSGNAHAGPVTEYCKPVSGYEQIIKNFNSITQGFNDKNWSLIDPYADDDISLTRIEGKAKKTHKKSKANYKEHLEKDAWKNNPNWSNVVCDPIDMGTDLVKLVVTYDFTFEKPSGGGKMTAPSFAVMFFKRKEGTMTDFTVGSLAR